MHIRMPFFLTLIALFAVGISQTTKKPLDHSDYDKWNSFRGYGLSPDGKWLQYGWGNFDGEGTLEIKSTNSTKAFGIPRGTGIRFVPGGEWALFTVPPSKAETDKARKDNVKVDDMPKTALWIFNLESGDKITIPKVRSFRTPDSTGEWFVYELEPGAAAVPATPIEPPKEAPKEGVQEPKKPEKRKDHAVGKTIFLRNFKTAEQIQLNDVESYSFTKNGDLIYVISSKTGETDGIYRWVASEKKGHPIVPGMARYVSVTLSEDETRLAFVSDRDDYKGDPASWGVYWVELSSGKVNLAAKEGSAGLPTGWWIVPRTPISFSNSGKRLFFNTVTKPPKPAATTPETPPATPVADKPAFDLWNWKDPLLQPMQLLQAEQTRSKTYRAMSDLVTGKVVQLETEEFPSLSISNKNEGRYALAPVAKPYLQEISWDGSYSDQYLMDLETGSKALIKKHHSGFMAFSPSGQFVYWYDENEKNWFCMDPGTRVARNITSKIPTKLFNELEDTPGAPSPYGTSGWTDGESRLLINDRYDIWSVDPTGKTDPVCVTDGYGRNWQLTFRIVRMGSGDTLNPESRLVLKAVDERSKDEGFYADKINGNRAPIKLFMEPKMLSAPIKAEKGDVVVYQREDFNEYPDLWINNTDLNKPVRMSDINPQQKDYIWGTSQLVDWLSSDGEKLQGVLYKPENYDPGKKYPMIVYFYERLSDQLHNYVTPSAGGGSINISFYVSRGYVVFTPDIPYLVGYPGSSAMKAIIPGVQSLIDMGIADKKRIGIQGHSWGGYQSAFLVTQTNMFACAEAGAPVSNMISAYGGIRWQTGMSRQFQYEKTQSRIGGTVWDKPLQFIENSPIFWIDRVQTPLLLLHNDNDGAVPWYQSIEMFTAMRRLGKPVWLVNYNGEGHGIGKRPNQKDWAIRMAQFFDYYLKGAPAPVWLTEGIPAVKKGKELGLDPAKSGG